MILKMVLVSEFLVTLEYREMMTYESEHMRDYIKSTEDDITQTYFSYFPSIIDSTLKCSGASNIDSILRYSIYSSIEFDKTQLNLMKLKDHHLYEMLFHEEDFCARFGRK